VPDPASFAGEREEGTLLKKAGLAVKRHAAGCRMASGLPLCKIVAGSGPRECTAQRSKMLKHKFWMNRYGGSALLAA
jgi:hypothetical protein